MSNINPNTTAKDLGLVCALITGITPPTNINVIWGDTTDLPTGPIVHKYYDPVTETWLPIGSGTGGGGGGGGTTVIANMNLGRVIFVSKQGNDVTGVVGSMLKPFSTIPAAITAAAALTPTAIDRVSIVLYPGLYTQSVTLNTDYIDLFAFTDQGEIYNEKLCEDLGATYNTQKRSTLIGEEFNWNSKNNRITGIDMAAVVVASQLITEPILTERRMSNCNVNFMGASAQASASHVHIIMNDTYVSECFNLQEHISVTLDAERCVFGQIQNATDAFTATLVSGKIRMNNCCVKTESFASGVLYYTLSESTFFKTSIPNYSISQMVNCKFEHVLFGNGCIVRSDLCSFVNCILGDDCVIDYQNSSMIDCQVGDNFAVAGVETSVLGTFARLKGDFYDGFLKGRPFRGTIRNSSIIADSTNPAVNVEFINGLTPANLEYSTIINCGAGETVDGGDCMLSYCKLNKSWANANILGAAGASYNIVSPYMCSYSSLAVCVAPNTLVLVTQSNLNPAVFSFTVNVPAARVGTILEITNPLGLVTTHIVETGNSGGATSISFNKSVVNPVPGLYSFRARTICSFDTLLQPDSVSQFSNTVVSTHVPAARPTAWRGIAPTCELGTATFTVAEFNPANGNHYIDRDIDDGTTGFSYNIYCSSTGVTVGPYDIAFTPGAARSGLQPGMAPSCFTDLDILAGSQMGTIVPANTGYAHYATLEKYYTDDNTAEGTTKPNISTDPDYIPHYYDTTLCPVPTI